MIKTPINASTPPDDKTITLNDEGELQNEKLIEVIGDFETDLGAWTYNGEPFDPHGRTTDKAYTGSYSVRIQQETSIEADLNLDDKSDLILGVNTSEGDQLDVYIDGNLVKTITVASGNGFTWLDKPVDVSNFSGTCTVKLECYNNDTYVDNIRLVDPESVTNTTVSDKAGGSTQ